MRCTRGLFVLLAAFHGRSHARVDSEELAAAVKEMDRDHDGLISFAEIVEANADMNDIAEEAREEKNEVRRMFEESDLDADGRMNSKELPILAERMRAFEETGGAAESKADKDRTAASVDMQELAEVVKEIDKNRDGLISKTEMMDSHFNGKDLTKEEQKEAKEVEHMFDASDLDADGKMNSRELPTLVERIHAWEDKEDIVEEADVARKELAGAAKQSAFLARAGKDLRAAAVVDMQEVAEAVKELDEDKDGFITFSEMIHGLSEEQQNKEEVKRMFDESDFDGDGRMNSKELAALAEHMRQAEEASTTREEGNFAALLQPPILSEQSNFLPPDLDGDGAISLAELLHGVEAEEEKTLGTRMFTVADTDGDGKVALAEMPRLIQGLQERDADDARDAADSKDAHSASQHSASHPAVASAASSETEM